MGTIACRRPRLRASVFQRKLGGDGGTQAKGKAAAATRQSCSFVVPVHVSVWSFHSMPGGHTEPEGAAWLSSKADPAWTKKQERGRYLPPPSLSLFTPPRQPLVLPLSLCARHPEVLPCPGRSERHRAGPGRLARHGARCRLQQRLLITNVCAAAQAAPSEIWLERTPCEFVRSMRKTASEPVLPGRRSGVSPPRKPKRFQRKSQAGSTALIEAERRRRRYAKRRSLV